MKVRGRVAFGPDHTLEGSDYDEAWALGKALACEWNARHKTKIDGLGVIVLDHEGPEYEELRRFFLARAKDVSPMWLKWSEQLEAVYTQRELEQSEILKLSVSDAGLGGNTYAQVYDGTACETCGVFKIHQQLRNAVTDLSKATKDLVSTVNFQERLVSERLRRLLENAGVEGVEFRPVEHARLSRPVKRSYFQLLVHNVLGPLLAPRHVWTRRCPSCGRESDAQDKGIEQPDPWTKIYRWNPGPWSEMHFARTSYRGWDLMRTDVMFGAPLSPSQPAPQFPDLLISQRLYRLLRQHKITGYEVQPAHLD